MSNDKKDPFSLNGMFNLGDTSIFDEPPEEATAEERREMEREELAVKALAELANNEDAIRKVLVAAKGEAVADEYYAEPEPEPVHHSAEDGIAYEIVKLAPQIEQTFASLAENCYNISDMKGFWDGDPERYIIKGDLLFPMLDQFVLHYKVTKYALVMTETAEAVEALRKGIGVSEHGFPAEAEEIADHIIRLLDYCGRYGYNIGEIIQRKMLYNLSRPQKHGGKKF